MMHQYLVCSCICVGLLQAATIGDGRSSLINGRPVDLASGSCQVGGVNFASETAVPRDHPCHYCICYAGKVDCFWKSCRNFPAGCEVMTFQDTCNPSLYVCDIPERARNAPDYSARNQVQQPASVFPTQEPTVLAPKIKKSSQSRFVAPQTAAPTTTTTSTTQKPAHAVESKNSVSSTSGSLMPAQYGLRMRQKKRFRRDSKTAIDEPFPIQFDEEFIQHLKQRIRSRRAINASSSDNHDHHHHHHDHPIDTGCTVLGVRYEVGEVIGVATDVCQECRCAAQSLYCSPKCCFKPAPLNIAQFQIQLFEDTSDRQQDDPALQHPLYYIQEEFL